MLYKTSLNIVRKFTNKCFTDRAHYPMIITPVSSSIKYFKIFRYDPILKCSRVGIYTVDTKECGPMVLDALLKIKDEQDSKLLFKNTCTDGICGSCAMIVDGVNILACHCYIDKSPKKLITITPLPHIYTF